MKRKAIFLDRDGVLIKNNTHYYIWKNEQLEIVDGVFDNLKLLIQQGFQLFIVSNQGGISKGIYTKSDILKFHNELLLDFKNEKIEIKEVLFCPHHPKIEKCTCRKPDSLMIEKLIAKYKLSREDSYFIGDSESDMLSNQNMYPFISFLFK